MFVRGGELMKTSNDCLQDCSAIFSAFIHKPISLDVVGDSHQLTDFKQSYPSVGQKFDVSLTGLKSVLMSVLVGFVCV